MKKTVFFLVLCLSVCFFCTAGFAVSAYGTGRTNGMGRTGTSGVDSDITYFTNPASLYYYNQRQKFLLEAYFYDSHTRDFNYLMELPDTGFKAEFVGKGVSVSIGLDKYAESFEKKEDGRRYVFRQRFDLAASFAYGYKNLALGAGLYGGSSRKRSDAFVNGNSFFGDFVKNMFFSEYSRDSSREFVSIELGAMYRLGPLVFSAKSDELLSYVSGNTGTLTFENALDTLGGGVYYASESYAKRGRLKKWVFSAAIEGKNLVNETNRSLHFGAEATYQLARDYNISGRLGYYSRFSDLSDGNLTFGLGGRINKVDVAFSADIPVSFISKNKGSVVIGLNVMYLI